jgi:hypothetical protein
VEGEVDGYVMALSKWLLMPLALCGLLVPPLLIIPNHAFDTSWPMHARFHVIWGAAKLFALGITQSLLILFPYSRGEPWSWFALASNLVFGGMSIGLASRVAQGPVPPWRDHDRSTHLMIICLVLSALGLTLGVEPVFLAP